MKPEAFDGRARHAGGSMLIDDVLPDFDASEHHEIAVAAPPDRVYSALRTADLGGHPVIRVLIALRSVPAVVLHWRQAGWRREPGPITLDTILQSGFALLAEQPGREVVLGIVGQFWRLTGNIVATDAARFGRPLDAGMARAAWNFAVTPASDGTTRLTTETRIQCADARARRWFLSYWLVVRPFSGLIRRLMLAQIARSCSGPSN